MTRRVKLTHIDRYGMPAMVGVGNKPITARKAVAMATVHINTPLATAIRRNAVGKGRVLEVARLAGIQAAKKAAELIPLCHPVPLEHIQVNVELKGRRVQIQATVEAHWKTGVEIEALIAATVAALTVYDMGKALDRAIRIDGVQLLEKTGGTRGDYKRSKS
ncbi:MAG TPA: cyclic pyranopterin monophosphate synthase MoaC [Phycisphaerae bacterium]|nr:cyclic pyranopterin monophosphate synthase MoaC [Phycisphaerae bacterium]